jgi:hypothetical protein
MEEFGLESGAIYLRNFSLISILVIFESSETHGGNMFSMQFKFPAKKYGISRMTTVFSRILISE